MKKYLLKRLVLCLIVIFGVILITFTISRVVPSDAAAKWAGIGKYVSSSVLSMDFPAIMGVTIFSAVSYMILNLIADLVVALDPRVRL